MGFKTIEDSQHLTAPFSKAEELSMAILQEGVHSKSFDYEAGSPHIRHSVLRRKIVSQLRLLVQDQLRRTGTCRVLEVGAGHGDFTDHIAAMGACVTVTEMSRPSLNSLSERYFANSNVRLVYDEDGEWVFRDAGRYDLVLCASVLHHIPDYLSFVSRVCDKIDPGGVFVSYQDPLWYPRRSKVNRLIERSAYVLWRSFQGNYRKGAMTAVRRIRGVYEDNNPSDMVEYHVVRQGVDETALNDLLCKYFESVHQWRYWSSQAPVFQYLLNGSKLHTTFSLLAQARRSDGN